MNEFTGGRTLVYRSDNIVERRKRILRVARRMIAEGGLSGFSVRELAQRAGIAQKTLYNAFGSKENVIALAIRQYMDDFNARMTTSFERGTLEERLEKLIKVHSRNLQIRPYTTAIMAVYNSFTADPAIRGVIRQVSEVGTRPFATWLVNNRQLAPGVTADSFIKLQITNVYATLTDWCLGEIPDGKLVDHIAENFLCGVVASTKGKTQAEAQRWLEDLRQQRPSWTALRKLAEVAPIESLELHGEKSATAKPRKSRKELKGPPGSVSPSSS
jgi:AcrR family transcriptional regulator